MRRPSCRICIILFLSLILFYKYSSGASSQSGFTAAIESSYGNDGSFGNFFSTDVKCILACIGLLLITYLPLGRVNDDIEDIWSSQRRARAHAR